MKSIGFLLFVLCLLPIGVSAQNANQASDNQVKNGYYHEKAANKTSDAGIYVNGEKDGAWANYNNKGLIRGVVEYKMGVKDGLELEFDRQGYVSKEQRFVDGKLNGEYREYLRGNYILIQANYLNGELEGEYVRYYSDKPSAKMEESFYKNGVKDGKSTFFAQNGRAIAEYSYKDGMFDGVNRTFYDTGAVKTEETYVNDVLQGEYREFFQDGRTVKVRGMYENGQKEGIWYEYDSKGDIISKTKYKNGEAK